VAFDALISDTAQAFREGLTPEHRGTFEQALEALLTDPIPDGLTKIALPFPYRPGTYGYEAGEFWLAYSFLNPMVLYIASAYWSPSSPNRPPMDPRPA